MGNKAYVREGILNCLENGINTLSDIAEEIWGPAVDAQKKVHSLRNTISKIRTSGTVIGFNPWNKTYSLEEYIGPTSIYQAIIAQLKIARYSRTELAEILGLEEDQILGGISHGYRCGYQILRDIRTNKYYLKGEADVL